MVRGVHILLGAIASFGVSSAYADAVADFYKGKQVEMIVGYGTGGGYDVYARALARYLGAYIPGNPNVVVQNMPGAGSLVSANYLYAEAPKDGTVIATFDRDMPLLAILGGDSNVRFDPLKFTWLGTASSYSDDAFLLFARKDAPIKTAEEARQPGGPQIVLGVTADGATDKDVGVLIRDVLGFNLKIIAGYPDGNAISLAVDRHELDARLLGLSAANSTFPQWLKPDGNMHVLMQFARATRHPEFPDVPTARELARDPKSLALVELAEMPYQLSRPFAAPPGIPADRAKALQDAFMMASRDKGYLADAAKLKIDVSPLDGAQVLQLITVLEQSPQDARTKLKELQAAP